MNEETNEENLMNYILSKKGEGSIRDVHGRDLRYLYGRDLYRAAFITTLCFSDIYWLNTQEKQL